MNEPDPSLCEPRVAICGADADGGTIWEALCLHSLADVVGFWDARERAQRNGFRGLPVLPLGEAGPLPVDRVFVPENRRGEWAERLRAAGVEAARESWVDTAGGVEAVLAQLGAILPAGPTPRAWSQQNPRRIGVFGTGQGGAKVWEVLLAYDEVEIAWFADNDSRKQGQRYLWADVIAPAEITARPVAAIVIASMYRKEIRAQLLTLGVAEHRILAPDVRGPLSRIAGHLRRKLKRSNVEVTNDRT
jgi:hypothetical protein